MRDTNSSNAPPDRGRVMVAGGDPDWVRSLSDALSTEGHRVLGWDGAARLADSARSRNPDVMILACGEGTDRRQLDRLRAARPDTQIVLVAGSASMDQALGWARAGLADYAEAREGARECLLLTVRRAVERRWLLARLAEFDVGETETGEARGLVASSNVMRENLRRATELARASSSVLIEGEEGSGRATLARAMHLAGPRREEPFIRVSCATLNGAKGGERDAAAGERPPAAGLEALFTGAGRGTIFLESLDLLTAGAQRELLARLEAQEQALLQGAASRAQQPRVIASTSTDLDLRVQRGQFDGNLYRRLKAESLRLPPLRDRREEIPELVRHFLRRQEGEGKAVKGIENAALNLLCRYEWPGNLQELDDCLRYAVAVTGSGSIRTDDLPEKIVEASRRQAAVTTAGPLSLKGYEKYTIEQALSLCDGDVVAAAGMLGIGRSTLYRKMKSHGVHRRSFRRARGSGD